MTNKLKRQEIQARLEMINNGRVEKWILSNDRIEKEFRFKDFKNALHFMLSVGVYAEEMNHHPEWHNIYNRVSIALTTHSEGGITELDFELAAKIEEVFYSASV